MEAFLIGLGAVIAGVVSLGTDFIREKWKGDRADALRRRELVEVRLPEVLRFRAAVQWLDYDLDRQLENVRHDNPYPDPGDVKTPGQWYQLMLEMSHLPTLPDEVRAAAKTVVDEIERWHAIVDDLEIGKDSTERMISQSATLIETLEAATK